MVMVVATAMAMVVPTEGEEMETEKKRETEEKERGLWQAVAAAALVLLLAWRGWVLVGAFRGGSRSYSCCRTSSRNTGTRGCTTTLTPRNTPAWAPG